MKPVKVELKSAALANPTAVGGKDTGYDKLLKLVTMVDDIQRWVRDNVTTDTNRRYFEHMSVRLHSSDFNAVLLERYPELKDKTWNERMAVPFIVLGTRIYPDNSTPRL